MSNAHKFLSLTFLVLMPIMWATTSTTDEYVASVNEWHKQRIERLKRPDSWLSLAGLFWLKPGVNTFGSDATNDLRFPDKAPPHIGQFQLEDGQVTVRINAGIDVFHKENKVSELSLQSDISGTPTVLRLGSFLFYVIDREGRLGIRLKDTKSERIARFEGIERFPVDATWRIKAHLDTTEAKVIKVPSIIGTVSEEPCPGALVFERNGHEYRLYPLGKKGDKSYFLIFGDETNGDQTYGAGRFLSVPAVNKKGETYIDFNKAYNPPCAFTPFATCPLPPRGNRLDLPVTAGEKNYGHDHLH